MDKEMLKINILSIAASGELMLLMGVGLYIFRDAVAKNIRFLLSRLCVCFQSVQGLQWQPARG